MTDVTQREAVARAIWDVSGNHAPHDGSDATWWEATHDGKHYWQWAVERAYTQADAALSAIAPVQPETTVRETVPVQDGAAMIAAERRRQIEVKGYTVERDDPMDLARAAEAYMSLPVTRRPPSPPPTWPWHRVFWKPTPDDRVRELVKAGALIAAAIDAEMAR